MGTRTVIKIFTLHFFSVKILIIFKQSFVKLKNRKNSRIV